MFSDQEHILPSLNYAFLCAPLYVIESSLVLYVWSRFIVVDNTIMVNMLKVELCWTIIFLVWYLYFYCKNITLGSFQWCIESLIFELVIAAKWWLLYRISLKDKFDMLDVLWPRTQFAITQLCFFSVHLYMWLNHHLFFKFDMRKSCCLEWVLMTPKCRRSIVVPFK